MGGGEAVRNTVYITVVQKSKPLHSNLFLMPCRLRGGCSKNGNATN